MKPPFVSLMLASLFGAQPAKAQIDTDPRNRIPQLADPFSLPQNQVRVNQATLTAPGNDVDYYLFEAAQGDVVAGARGAAGNFAHRLRRQRRHHAVWAKRPPPRRHRRLRLGRQYGRRRDQRGSRTFCGTLGLPCRHCVGCCEALIAITKRNNYLFA